MSEPRGVIPRFYWYESLNVETYDIRHPVAMEGTPIAGDVAFYRGLAEEVGGAVLELACGTGRVAIALAEAGLAVTGLDRSEPMLAVAREKVANADPEVAGRVDLVLGDMTAFDLGRRFGLAVIAFRSFQSLLNPELQSDCLRAIHAHLEPGGRLALNLFDPLLDKCAPGSPPFEHAISRGDVWLPNGHAVQVAVTAREVDPITQVMRETWRFTEIRPGRDRGPRGGRGAPPAVDVPARAALPPGAPRVRGGGGVFRFRRLAPRLREGADRGRPARGARMTGPTVEPPAHRRVELPRGAGSGGDPRADGLGGDHRPLPGPVRVRRACGMRWACMPGRRWWASPCGRSTTATAATGSAA